MNLKGKTALITGGAVRVGRALTLALAREGCRLFIHYGRSEAEARATQSDAERLGAEVRIGSADLADPGAAVALLATAADEWGPVEILVNNAAVFFEGKLATTTLEDWDRQFAINLRAPFLLCQAFARQAGARGGIVNILDARIFRPGMDHFAYRLTKTALAAMTENLALELAPRIAVNGIALGAILAPSGASSDHLERLAAERIPLRRPGTPDAVCDALLYLLRQDFVTGTILRVDGGEFI